jgi:carbonic anhydrase
MSDRTARERYPTSTDACPSATVPRPRVSPIDTPDAKTPRAGVVVLACMDVRVDPLRLLGYEQPDAHVLRNAGALVTDDVLRSLVVSQRLLGTRRVDVLAHTDCGAGSPGARDLEARLGRDLCTFDDIDRRVRASLQRLREDPDLILLETRGFVFDVDTGAVREVR